MYDANHHYALKTGADGWWGGGGLTQLVPELPALVGHARALLSPQREAGVGHELLRDERQHPCPIGVPHAQHLPHLLPHTEQA